MDAHANRYVAVYCCQLLAKDRLLPMFPDPLLQFSFQLVGMGDNLLYAPILTDQSLCRLFPDSRNTRNVVDRIAPQTQDINNLLGSINFPAGTNLGHAHNLYSVAHARGLVQKNTIRHQLGEILVGRHHINPQSFPFRLSGQRANDVVGFIARHFQ